MTGPPFSPFPLYICARAIGLIACYGLLSNTKSRDPSFEERKKKEKEKENKKKEKNVINRSTF